MHILTPPADIDPIWEGEFTPANVRDTKARNEARNLRPKSARGTQSSQLPIVSVGRAEVWNVRDLWPEASMSPMLEKRLDTSNFFLVRLVCSFRPRFEECSIKSAVYSIRLHSRRGLRPLVYDLHPINVSEESRVERRVMITPTLKFAGFEVGIGSGGLGVEYPELLPVISGAGIGEQVATWDFRETRGNTIQGSRIMHLLMSVPTGLESVVGTVELTGTIRRFGELLPVRLGGTTTEEGARLTAVLVAPDQAPGEAC